MRESVMPERKVEISVDACPERPRTTSRSRRCDGITRPSRCREGNSQQRAHQ